MHTENRIEIYGDIEEIFQMAAAICEWPKILPHYRWVKILKQDERKTVAEMAAHRDGIPVRWSAIQEVYPEEKRITYTHIGGFTKGMEVEWRMEQEKNLVKISITHDFTLSWPFVGIFISRYIVGEFFVRNIASKTLRAIKRHIEKGYPWIDDVSS
ncbi:MAG: hypothetical protein HY731_08240 [Candidatus Tectomicrobia bacterium]|nr:hypothetical protein [Candidatus Tectomicrobia bacterium]